MKCSICRTENAEGKKFCGECGTRLAVFPVEVEPTESRMCVSCGRPISGTAAFCQYCGRDTRVTAPSATNPEGTRKPLSSKLAVASMLLIIGGAISLAGLTILYHEYFGDRSYQVTAMENMMTVVWIICAVMGMVGGIVTAYRYNVGVAVAGAAFCVVAGFPIYYVGMIPGIVALVLLVLGRKEFSN